VALHHFTLPLWFARDGGWLRADAVDRFLNYVDAIAPVLDAGAQRVETINEPNIVAMFPKLTSGLDDLAGGLPVPDEQVTDVMIAVHRATVQRLRANHPGVRVGWGVSVQDYQAEPGAEAALRDYVEPRDQVFLRASVGDDFVGVQTYTRGQVRADGTLAYNPTAERTLTGWQFYPPALGGAVRRAAGVVGNVPIIVTENGVATDDDTRRIEYTTGALCSLRTAMEDGVDVRGYFHWSMLDNWEWGHWEPTFGLVAVDRTTFTRTPKPSLAWLGGLAPTAGTPHGPTWNRRSTTSSR
jgi:beta-glucosidase